MSETNFKPVFDYIDQAKQEILEEVPSKAQIEKLQSSVDGLAKWAKDNEDDILVLEKKTERLEHWTIEASEKIKVPYKP